MKMHILLFAALLAVAACGQSTETTPRIVIQDSQDQDVAQPIESTVPAGSGIDDGPAGGEQKESYTMTEVAMHSNDESCWTVVRGEVYDVTSWIGQHPGGAGYIRRMCGTDGTYGFEGKHGGQDKPEARLSDFRIGVLV